MAQRPLKSSDHLALRTYIEGGIGAAEAVDEHQQYLLEHGSWDG